WRHRRRAGRRRTPMGGRTPDPWAGAPGRGACDVRWSSPCRARSASASLHPSADRGWSVWAVRVWCDSAARSGSASWGASGWSKAWQCVASSTSYPLVDLDPGVGPPWLPLNHATAQHRRHGACEDSDVMLRGTRGRDDQRGPGSLLAVLACEEQDKDTCSRPPPHRQGRLFWMGASAQCRGTRRVKGGYHDLWYTVLPIKPTVCPSHDPATMLSNQWLLTSIQWWRGHGQEAKRGETGGYRITRNVKRLSRFSSRVRPPGCPC